MCMDMTGIFRWAMKSKCMNQSMTARRLTMEINSKRFLAICTFVHVISNLVLGLEIFSPLNVNINADAKIATCHFTKTTRPTPGILAICGFKGETCSIAVKKNQSETLDEKEVNCDCLEQVISNVDKAYHNIPGKLLSNYLQLFEVFVKTQIWR